MGCTSSVSSNNSEAPEGERSSEAGEGSQAAADAVIVPINTPVKTSPISSRLNDVQEEKEDEEPATEQNKQSEADPVPLLNDALKERPNSAESNKSQESAKQSRSLHSVSSESTRRAGSGGSSRSGKGSLSPAEPTLPGAVQDTTGNKEGEEAKQEEADTAKLDSKSIGSKSSLTKDLKSNETGDKSENQLSKDPGKDADSTTAEEPACKGQREAPDGDEGRQEVAEILKDEDQSTVVQGITAEVKGQRKYSSSGLQELPDNVASSARVKKQSAKSTIVSISDLLSDSDFNSTTSQSPVRAKSAGCKSQASDASKSQPQSVINGESNVGTEITNQPPSAINNDSNDDTKITNQPPSAIKNDDSISQNQLPSEISGEASSSSSAASQSGALKLDAISHKKEALALESEIKNTGGSSEDLLNENTDPIGGEVSGVQPSNDSKSLLDKESSSPERRSQGSGDSKSQINSEDCKSTNGSESLPAADKSQANSPGHMSQKSSKSHSTSTKSKSQSATPKHEALSSKDETSSMKSEKRSVVDTSSDSSEKGKDSLTDNRQDSSSQGSPNEANFPSAEHKEIPNDAKPESSDAVSNENVNSKLTSPKATGNMDNLIPETNEDKKTIDEKDATSSDAESDKSDNGESQTTVISADKQEESTSHTKMITDKEGITVNQTSDDNKNDEQLIDNKTNNDPEEHTKSQKEDTTEDSQASKSNSGALGEESEENHDINLDKHSNTDNSSTAEKESVKDAVPSTEDQDGENETNSGTLEKKTETINQDLAKNNTSNSNSQSNNSSETREMTETAEKVSVSSMVPDSVDNQENLKAIDNIRDSAVTKSDKGMVSEPIDSQEESKATEDINETTDTRSDNGIVSYHADQSEESKGAVADHEGQSDESKGVVFDPEGQSEESKGVVSDPEGQSDESKGIVSDPEGQSDESKGVVSDPEGQSDESKGVVSDPEGQSSESKYVVSYPEDQSVESQEQSEESTKTTCVDIEALRGPGSTLSIEEIAESPLKEYATAIKKEFNTIAEDSGSATSDARSIRGFS